MTDPLGQSQVLPYLKGLALEGYEFTILSFEKPDRYEKEKSTITNLCKASKTKWNPLTFHTNPPILSKAYDRWKMKRVAESLHSKNNYSIVHCRSYAASEVGLFLKNKYGIRFLFDMRGFWADEKKDGGQWPQSSFLYRKIYEHYKKKEKSFVQLADHIISLTYAGKKEIETWSFYNTNIPITVIPCCADMNHFTLTDNDQKKKYRASLNLPQESFVVSYLGSIGAWYLLDEMFQLFIQIKIKYPKALFFFISHSNPSIITNRAAELGINASNIIIKEANRSEVPSFLKTSDITLSFIKPVYSKLSSSPTKLGEVMGMGIPVITNSGVGDVAEIVTGRGIVLHDFSKSSLENAVNDIPELLQINSEEIRNRSLEWFDLEKGVQKYIQVYSILLNK
jgi:glycosyltransferase involved in cell wall biosynthesis